MVNNGNTIGELVDAIEPGETVQVAGFEITRWPDPDETPASGAPNRATRRGNKLHPRSAKNHADYRPGTVRPY